MRLKMTIIIMTIGIMLGGASVFSEEAGHDHKKDATPVDKPAAVQKPKKPAHGDHTPKFGGQFFMAPDKFHHLEGALPTANEFRIYLYDDHTKPVSAKSFLAGAKIGVQMVGTDGRETGTILDLPVTIDETGRFLVARIPAEMTLPLYFTTYLTFPNRKEPDLFNFTFDKVSVSPARAPSKASSEKSGS